MVRVMVASTVAGGIKQQVEHGVRTWFRFLGLGKEYIRIVYQRIL